MREKETQEADESPTKMKWKKEKNALPLGEAPLETLWERMMAIQPSTSTKASFLNSAKNTTDRHGWANRKKSQ